MLANKTITKKKKIYKGAERQNILKDFFKLSDSERANFLELHDGIFITGSLYNVFNFIPDDNNWPSVGMVYSDNININATGNIVACTNQYIAALAQLSIKLDVYNNVGAAQGAVGIGFRNSINGPPVQQPNDLQWPDNSIGEFAFVAFVMNLGNLSYQPFIKYGIQGSAGNVAIPATPTSNATLTLQERADGIYYNVYDPTVPLLNNWTFYKIPVNYVIPGTLRSPFIYNGKNIAGAAALTVSPRILINNLLFVNL